MYKQQHSFTPTSRKDPLYVTSEPIVALEADFEDISLRDSIQTVSTAPTSPLHSISDSGSSKSRSSSSSIGSTTASAPTSLNASTTAFDITLRPSEADDCEPTSSASDGGSDDGNLTKTAKTSQKTQPEDLQKDARPHSVRLNSYAMKSLKCQPSLSLMRDSRTSPSIPHSLNRSVGLGLSFGNENTASAQMASKQSPRLTKRNSADSYLTMSPSPNSFARLNRMSAPLSSHNNDSSSHHHPHHHQLPRRSKPLLQRALSTNHLPRMDQRLSPSLSQKHVFDVQNSPSSARQQRQRQKTKPSRRLSADELEMKFEMEETDDYDLPDDACMFNVPLSPALFAKQSPAMKSSPSLSSPRSSLPSMSPASSLKNLSRSRSFGSPGSNTDSTRSSYASDIMSSPLPSIIEAEQMNAFDQSAAMSDLSYEARLLTHKLRDFPEPAPRTPPSNSSRNSTTSLSSAKGLSKSSSMDTLSSPAGTRPGWLPPKTPEEEQKHLDEYKRLIEQTAQSDKKKRDEERQKRRSKLKQHSKDELEWKSKILAADSFTKYVEKNYISTRELWWRGLPSKYREAVWSKAIGNDLNITGRTYENCLSKCDRSKWFDVIEKDVTHHAFPDLNIFGKESGPLHNDLTNILLAATSYEHPALEKLGHYTRGLDILGAVFLLNMTPLNAFKALVNFIVKISGVDESNQNGVLMALLCKDEASISVYHASALKVLNSKVPQLYRHFQKTRVAPSTYLDPLMCDVFSRNLSLDIMNRIFDIMVFEGDNVLLRVALAITVLLEPYLYGKSSEIKAVVGWNSKMLNVPLEDEFIDAVRQVLRGSSR